MNTLESKKNSKSTSKDLILALYRSEFDRDVPTANDAENIIYERLSNAGMIVCTKCCGSRFTKKPSSRKVVCLSCKNRQSFTAHTFFHGMKKMAAKEYLFLLTLFERGIVVNASEFQRHSSVAYSTSLSMIKKCAMVIEQTMQSETLTLLTCSEIKDAVYKRSIETPARKHPRCEQIVETQLECFEPVCDCGRSYDTTVESVLSFAPESPESVNAFEVSDHDATEMPEEQRNIFNLLTDKPVHFDDICKQMEIGAGALSSGLVMLELDGLVTRQNEFYSRKSKTALANYKSSLSITLLPAGVPSKLGRSLTAFLRNEFRGISQKCSQLYLALHWYSEDKRIWTKDRLLNACLASKPITYKDVRNYKSPKMLNVFSAA